MLIDYSTFIHERQVKCLILERSENGIVFTCLPHGQSILMTNRAAEQILGKLEIISIYLETYSLDVKVIMEAELNEPNHFVPCP